MKSTGNRRVLIALVFFALLAATLILVGRAEEAVAASNCTYYSNASHTTVVGQFGYDCCNNRVAWGVKTAYKTCGGCFPCFPPPR
ncbi:MAG: hypothetical protein KC591_10725 [Gemmatimonadetes bacterium]|nr:hypothetical protein [Gemmatimonadota bacterium]